MLDCGLQIGTNETEPRHFVVARGLWLVLMAIAYEDRRFRLRPFSPPIVQLPGKGRPNPGDAEKAPLTGRRSAVRPARHACGSGAADFGQLVLRNAMRERVGDDVAKRLFVAVVFSEQVDEMGKIGDLSFGQF